MTLIKMVRNVLKERPGIKFTSRDIAERLVEKYKNTETLQRKRQNPRFNSNKDLINQIQAEIGSTKPRIKSIPNIIIEEQVRPKLYMYEENNIEQEVEQDQEDEQEDVISDTNDKQSLSEIELYPLLGVYLKNEEHILSKRIDESKSKNNRGPSGNKWLHPDIVGIKILDELWEPSIKDCIKEAGDNKLSVFSYEVKISITSSNLRKYFFQAVSNSSWANSGYLVAAEIKDEAFEELKMLSSLHGIGFILLDCKNPTESQIMLQAKIRDNVDWASANRLYVQNSDFQSFIKSINGYYKAEMINKFDWY